MHGLDRRVVWTLVALAVLARAAAVLVLQSHTVPRSTYEHGEIAANLLAGRGFAVRFLGADGPTSQQAPLYPFLLAGAYALGGVETPASLLIVQLGQALLGGLLVAGVLRLAGEVAPGRRGVALGAGLIAALHPTLVYAATHVQVALPAAVLVVWSLAFGYRTGRTGRDRDALMAGGLLALLALTDPILALAGVGVLAAIGMGERTRPLRRPASIGCHGFGREPVSSRGNGHGFEAEPVAPGRLGKVRSGCLVVLAAGVGVAPWTVRNAIVHGEPVFIKSTFGYAFWQGNCALSEGTDKVVRATVERALVPEGAGLKGLNEALWKARHEAGYLDDIALTAADYRALGALSEPERSRVLFRRALADLGAEPGRYARLCLRRLRYFALFDETNPKTRNIVYRAGHLGLSLLAVAGLIAAPRDLRRRLGPTLLVAGLIAAFHALTIVSARFHVPIEPLLGLWAGGLLARVGGVASAAAAGDVVGVGVAPEGLGRVAEGRRRRMRVRPAEA
jgi:hypothetical protein